MIRAYNDQVNWETYLYRSYTKKTLHDHLNLTLLLYCSTIKTIAIQFANTGAMCVSEYVKLQVLLGRRGTKR